MSVSLFCTIVMGGAAVTALLTQAIKKAYSNANKPYSPNVIAVINALVVGCGGCAVVYMLLGIPWTVNNIICLALSGFFTWIGSMIGYDSIHDTLKQLSELKVKKEEINGRDRETPVGDREA